MWWCWGRGAAAPLQVGHPQRDVSLFQFDDVIDNIMRLDSVLGYINPEMQIPNTVLGGLDGSGMAHTVGPWLGRVFKAELVPLWRQESPLSLL